MSTYERKSNRRVGSIRIESNSSLAGKFSHFRLYGKDAVTSLFDFYVTHRKLDVFSPEKTHIIFSLKI